ncbi:MAG: hypothetical protein Q8S73_31765 [Deltaproteobacteria bacterium]|nr:hypothetical protein [Myxococcales bacterium]MDP3218725.1 hypothetical protein [Deltaproteobacteria bacterium]
MATRAEPYWSEFLPQLREGFGRRCGYAAMYIPDGTVDHFRSRRDHRGLLYEWTNLRFASSLMNAAKKAAEVLDPFEVGDGWFEVLLPSMELVARFDLIPPARHALVRATLAILPLVHDERIVRQRREWYAFYLAGEITFERLQGFAPLVAAAVDRWRSAHPNDPLP